MDRLEAERVRREQAEHERDELRRQLEALQETRDAPETATEGEAGTEHPARIQANISVRGGIGGSGARPL